MNLFCGEGLLLDFDTDPDFLNPYVEWQRCRIGEPALPHLFYDVSEAQWCRDAIESFGPVDLLLAAQDPIALRPASPINPQPVTFATYKSEIRATAAHVAYNRAHPRNRPSFNDSMRPINESRPQIISVTPAPRGPSMGFFPTNARHIGNNISNSNDASQVEHTDELSKNNDHSLEPHANSRKRHIVTEDEMPKKKSRVTRGSLPKPSPRKAKKAETEEDCRLPRAGPEKPKIGSWSSEEGNAINRTIRLFRFEEQMRQKVPLRDESFWEEISKLFSARGVSIKHRSWSSCKSWWARYGRTHYRYDESNKKKVIEASSTQGMAKKDQKAKAPNSNESGNTTALEAVATLELEAVKEAIDMSCHMVPDSVEWKAAFEMGKAAIESLEL